MSQTSLVRRYLACQCRYEHRCAILTYVYHVHLARAKDDLVHQFWRAKFAEQKYLILPVYRFCIVKLNRQAKI